MKIGIAIVVAIVLVAAFVPLVQAEYRHTETYYEDEPYEAVETYTEDVPLAYEIVESYDRTDSVLIRAIGVLEDELVEVFYLIGRVTVKNTDIVGGTFSVHFTFYWLDRHNAAQSCHPDFDATDYLAAEDQEAYLDQLDWDKLDFDEFTLLAERYDGEEQLTLEPGETGTAEHSVLEGDPIDFVIRAVVDEDELQDSVWKWEYTITEPTKLVERERTVTKYRQVEKERLVIQHKRVPIFEYLFS